MVGQMELLLIVTIVFVLLAGVFYSAERYKRHYDNPEQ